MIDIMEYLPKSNWGRLPGSLALVFGFWHKECWVLLGVWLVATVVAHIVGQTRFSQAERPVVGLALIAYYAAAGDVVVRILLWVKHLTAA